MGAFTPHAPDTAARVVQSYGDLLFRLALLLLGKEQDAEDAVQETLLKYLQKAPPFQSPAHEKAWLIRVLTNQCHDMQRFRLRHPQVPLCELTNYVSNPESCGILEALMVLPEKFKVVLLLYYVEEYRVEEIAYMIGRSPSAVKMRLQKGRKLLEEQYRKEGL